MSKVKLGSGVYGRIYRTTRNKQPFALKVNTGQNHVSFLTSTRELDLLGQMSHSEYIIKLIGIERHGRRFATEEGYRVDNLGMVFELAECDLQHFIDGSSKYPRTEERYDRYIRELLLGLNELHINGFLHRDIKPDNVLIINDRVKYCDFGMAKRYMEKMSPRVTAKEYRAPEVASGSSYDQRADVWSLGCLFVELLSGRCPDSSNHPRELQEWFKWVKDSKWSSMIREMLCDVETRPSCSELIQKFLNITPKGKQEVVQIAAPEGELLAVVEEHLPLLQETEERYRIGPIRRNTVYMFHRYLQYAREHGVETKRKLPRGPTLTIWSPSSREERAIYDHRWRFSLCHYIVLKYYYEEGDLPSFDRLTGGGYKRHQSKIAEFEKLLVSQILQYKIWFSPEMLPN